MIKGGAVSFLYMWRSITMMMFIIKMDIMMINVHILVAWPVNHYHHRHDQHQDRSDDKKVQRPTASEQWVEWSPTPPAVVHLRKSSLIIANHWKCDVTSRLGHADNVSMRIRCTWTTSLAKNLFFLDHISQEPLGITLKFQKVKSFQHLSKICPQTTTRWIFL